jgi:hypothetical protein
LERFYFSREFEVTPMLGFGVVYATSGKGKAEEGRNPSAPLQ